MVVHELLTYVFGDTTPVLAAHCAEWMASSRRFKAFVETYRDKIRKKNRSIQDEEGRRDLQVELATAYLLLQERRFVVEYEPYGVGKQRGPDFRVTFKTHIHFNVEVTRIRGPSREQRAREPEDYPKLAATVCDKLGQMPPSMSNILVLAVDGAPYSATDIANAMRLLKIRADLKEEPFFVRRGFSSAQDFLKHYTRLSGVLIREAGEHGSSVRAELWSNPEARHPLPAAVRTILQR